MLDYYTKADGRILIVHVTGRLTREDYREFQPETERLIERHGTIRVLCHMHDFHGWQWGALWEDLKFDVRHFADIERLALVGHSRWQAHMTALCRPFTTAEVRYFDERDLAQAEHWIVDDLLEYAMHNSQSVDDSFDVVHEAGEESFPASDSPAY